MLDSYNLNPMQRLAVETLDGPVLILAGAGSGKTKTLTLRILNLIKHGAAPGDILAITFTNKAAGEMRERVHHLLETDLGLRVPTSDFFIEGRMPFIGTFHGLGVNIIKRFHTEAGVKKNFAILDKSESKRILKEAIVSLGMDPKEQDDAHILGIISREKGAGNSFADYSATNNHFFGKKIAQIWEAYEVALRREGALDFDDLLLISGRLLGEEHIRKHYEERWKYVHIDEYQDTNKSQYGISRAIAGHNNICVVGDPDQNIYSWRGANIQNILNFERDYKGAKKIILEENYRSTQTILAVANLIIEKNLMREKKSLVTRNGMGEKVRLYEAWNETNEAAYVAGKCKELHDREVPYGEMAVLYRANFQSRVLEEAFLLADVPYKVIGTKFYDRKEVKDILAFLRYAYSRESITDLRRIINVPPRGIGKTTFLKIVEGKEGELPIQMRFKVENFRTLMNEIKNFASIHPPSKAVMFVAERTKLLSVLEGSKKDEDQERVENIKELAVLASRYDTMSVVGDEGAVDYSDAVQKLLEDTSLVSDQDSDTEDIDSVRLMTVHASKGLEFGYVFIAGLEQGLFPSDRGDEDRNGDKAEEERRLFYVALTRAKRELFLSYALSRTIYGKRDSGEPSLFLLEIPEIYMEKEYFFGANARQSSGRKSLLDIDF